MKMYNFLSVFYKQDGAKFGKRNDFFFKSTLNSWECDVIGADSAFVGQKKCWKNRPYVGSSRVNKASAAKANEPTTVTFSWSRIL